MRAHVSGSREMPRDTLYTPGGLSFVLYTPTRKENVPLGKREGRGPAGLTCGRIAANENSHDRSFERTVVSDADRLADEEF